MKNYLFISDLHTEKYNVDDMLEFIAWFHNHHSFDEIFFIGDCGVFKLDIDRLKGLPIIFIAGNHELSITDMIDYHIVDNHILLIHGHNAESWYERFCSEIYDMFMGIKGMVRRVKKKLKKPYVVSFPKPTSMPSKYSKRVNKLLKYIEKNYSTEGIDTIIIGHHHKQYIAYIRDFKILNCGAGFDGEFIVSNRDGSYEFASVASATYPISGS